MKKRIFYQANDKLLFTSSRKCKEHDQNLKEINRLRKIVEEGDPNETKKDRLDLVARLEKVSLAYIAFGKAINDAHFESISKSQIAMLKALEKSFSSKNNK